MSKEKKKLRTFRDITKGTAEELEQIYMEEKIAEGKARAKLAHEQHMAKTTPTKTQQWHEHRDKIMEAEAKRKEAMIQNFLKAAPEEFKKGFEKIRKLSDKLLPYRKGDKIDAENKVVPKYEKKISKIWDRILKLEWADTEVPTIKLYPVSYYENKGERLQLRKKFSGEWLVEGVGAKPEGTDSEGRPTKLTYKKAIDMIRAPEQGKSFEVPVAIPIEYSTLTVEEETAEAIGPTKKIIVPEKKPKSKETVEYTIAICPYCKHQNNQVPIGKEFKCMVCGKVFTVNKETTENTKKKGLLDKVKEKLS